MISAAVERIAWYNLPKKGGVWMKKDIFNGKVKREYIGYMWSSILLATSICLCVGAMILFTAFQREPGSADRNGLLITSIPFFLYGLWFFSGALFVIRRYPKSQKFVKCFFNSDCYFVGNNSKEYHGTWKGKRAFELITAAAEQNKGLEGIKYPKNCKVYTALTVIGIALMLVYLGIAYAAIENLDVLPKAMQNEGLIFAALIVAEVLDVVLTFVFAFRVRKIKKETVSEYKIKYGENKKTANEK